MEVAPELKDCVNVGRNFRKDIGNTGYTSWKDRGGRGLRDLHIRACRNSCQ